MIFGNKQTLLRLYNAINGSTYTNPDDPIINTIEGVLYLGMNLELPTPKYVVFYNGTKEDGDSRVLRLSDSFIKKNGEEACLECTATMININYGHNKQLMD